MDIEIMIRPESIRINSSAHSSDEVLHEIAELAAANPLLAGHSTEQLFHALKAREEEVSTGFADGIAIPHCAFDDVSGFAAGLLTTAEGIDFRSADGKPTRIFAFLVGDAGDRSGHIHLLSSISIFLKEPENRQKLLEAEEAAEAYRCLLHGLQLETRKGGGPHCMVEAFVQREDAFEDILELFASHAEGSVSVQELRNAGSYMHPLPLFSALWTEEERADIKLIRGIVPKSLVNDIIRRINTLEPGLLSASGVLIAVQDLFYSAGSIEF